MLFPKAASQVGKTILGPFTHLRNFFSAGFSVANGNILIPPTKLAKFVGQAFREACAATVIVPSKRYW